MTVPIPLVILGSTGSIGTQALEVVRSHGDRFTVFALAAGGTNPHLLASQVLEFRPTLVAIADADPAKVEEVAQACSAVGAELLVGPNAAADVAGSCPTGTVLNGITGGVGLLPTLAALESGATLALANKESLVVGGHLVKAALQRPGQIVPVDSEHSAIAQALLTGVHNRGLTCPNLDGKSELHSLVLTASGGPFRGKVASELKEVTAKQALAHPTWDMGPVVTINSSTLMNKGLELIEAAVLFDVPAKQITTVVHPQSIVHSMVTWNDGSTIAQASYPNMAVPIALGLDWPKHLHDVGAPLSWEEPTAWTFEPVDHETFPALKLAAQALDASGTHPGVLNAANEVAVAAFLQGRFTWLEITNLVQTVLGKHDGVSVPSLEDVLEAQRWAVAQAEALVS